jgi:hypothetical protein
LLFIIPFPASRRRQVAAHQAVAMLARGQRSVALFTGGRPECSPITRSASRAFALRYPETPPGEENAKSRRQNARDEVCGLIEGFRTWDPSQALASRCGKREGYVVSGSRHLIQGWV